MSRNFGHPSKDVDPKVKQFFPWALFLVVAIVFGIAATYIHKPTVDDYACYGRDQYQAMWDNKPICKKPGLIARARDFFENRSAGQDVGDPYGCFGGGRYEAMSEGRVCPGFEGK